MRFLKSFHRSTTDGYKAGCEKTCSMLYKTVHYAEMQQVPHWSLDQHEHRHELTKIMHEATEGVAAAKVKPRKLYVTDAIFEVSAHRARLIQTKHKEEKQV